MRTLCCILAALLLFPLAGCGGRKGEFKEFTPADGDYTILMPGKPTREKGSEEGFNITGYVVDYSEGGYVVGSTDLPAGKRYDSEGVVSKLASAHSGSWRSDGLALNGESWREFEIDGDQTLVSGRVVISRGRAYLFYAYGKEARLSNPEVRAFIESFSLQNGVTPGPETLIPPPPPVEPPPYRPTPSPQPQPQPQFPVTPPQPQFPVTPPQPSQPQPPKETIVGWPFDPEFREEAPNNGLLVGFDVWYSKGAFGNDTISAVRPIFRSPDNVVSAGLVHGKETDRGARVLARAGYAIGQINVKAGLSLDGISVTFMKVNGKKLEVGDSYVADKIGAAVGATEGKVGGDGTPATGIVGRKKDNNPINAIGLAYPK